MVSAMCNVNYGPGSMERDLVEDEVVDKKIILRRILVKQVVTM
jgi:hypothetical protein